MNTAKKRSITAIVLVACCALTSLGLAIAKLYVGLRSNSLVIMLDGMNSFFDVATTLVTVVAFCMLLAPRSPRRPFGMGRSEYLAGFVVAMVTVIMGVVFFFRSFTRLAMPEPVYYRLSSLIIMLVALAVKIGMAVAYGLVNRRVCSSALRALLLDSLLDVGVTLTAVISFVVSQRVSYAVDAWLGVATSVAVVAVGAKMVVDNVRLLLGGGQVEEDRQRVRAALNAETGVERVCDVVLADYGYRNKVGYAEVVLTEGVGIEELSAITEAVNATLAVEGITVHLVPRRKE